MVSKLAIQMEKCATCKFYKTNKKIIMFGKMVEVEKSAPCMKTYNGRKVNYTNTCKNYTKDPYL